MISHMQHKRTKFADEIGYKSQVRTVLP